MTVSANVVSVKVTITDSGSQGVAGTDGTDGIGFNNVRKALIDNPLSWLYKTNNFVNILNQVLTVDRPVTGNYTDIYGAAQVAAVDTPREEVKGWLITDNEIHTYNILNNIPLLDGGFSAVFRVGSYAEGAASQDIITIPTTAGNSLVIGTNGSGNWVATVQGTDTLTYSAVTAVSATSTSTQVIIVTYTAGTLNINIDNALAGTVTVTPGSLIAMDLDETLVNISGDITLNTQGLRFYDFVLNADEITYIND